MRLVKDPAHPLLNRTIQGQYPPGSVFKIIVTAAGLQEGTLTPMDRVYCNGEFTSGTRTLKDWKQGGHGHVDLRGAMRPVVRRLLLPVRAQDRAARPSRSTRTPFGLGSPTGIDLPGEKPRADPVRRGPQGARAPLARRRHR